MKLLEYSEQKWGYLLTCMIYLLRESYSLSFLLEDLLTRESYFLPYLLGGFTYPESLILYLDISLFDLLTPRVLLFILTYPCLSTSDIVLHVAFMTAPSPRL